MVFEKIRQINCIKGIASKSSKYDEAAAERPVGALKTRQPPDTISNNPNTSETIVDESCGKGSKSKFSKKLQQARDDHFYVEQKHGNV